MSQELLGTEDGTSPTSRVLLDLTRVFASVRAVLDGLVLVTSPVKRVNEGKNGVGL